MNAKQVIGLVIVALAAVGTFVVPRGGTDAPKPTGPTHGCPNAHEPDEDATLCLINAERRKHGRRRLTRNDLLHVAASAHAMDMHGRGYFAHRSPRGTTPHQRIVRAGYPAPRLTGENLAKGEGAAGAPSSIVDGWMHSPGHRANILRRGFAEIGVAIVERDDLAMYVTTFGRRQAG